MVELSRTCPYCVEEIKVEAVKCKHCGSEVAPLSKEQQKQLTREAEKASYVPYPIVFLVFIAIGFWIYYQVNDTGSSSVTVSPVKTVEPAATATPVAKVAPVVLVEVSHWGDYESWTRWKVFIVPENISRNELITVARKTFKKHPNIRSRFFDNAEKIQEQIDAEKFVWDTTGAVARSEFPTEWRKQHLIGIINDRSDAGYGRWQVVFNKGGVSEHLAFLD